LDRAFSRRILLLQRELLQRGSLSTREAVALTGDDEDRCREALRTLVELDVGVDRVGERKETRYVLSRTDTALLRGDMEALALHLGLEQLRWLRGTSLWNWAQDAEATVLAGFGATDQARFARLFSRFLRLPEPGRVLAHKDDVIEEVVTAVYYGRRIDVVFEGKELPGLHAAALVEYRRALYLLAWDGDERRALRLAMDRMERAERRRHEEAVLPSGFDAPSELRRGFGIRASGEPEDVVLRFEARVAKYVLARDWHWTARVEEMPEGRVLLRMRTCGEELVRFCLEWGETVEVLEPGWLRERVVEELKGALGRYGVSGHGSGDVSEVLAPGGEET